MSGTAYLVMPSAAQPNDKTVTASQRQVYATTDSSREGGLRLHCKHGQFVDYSKHKLKKKKSHAPLISPTFPALPTPSLSLSLSLSLSVYMCVCNVM